MTGLWVGFVSNNGTETRYENVSKITPSVVYDYNYNVKTMDGRPHREIKGFRVNYEVVFFNNDLDKFDELIKFVANNKIATVKFPTTSRGFIKEEYIITVNGFLQKGKTLTGRNYRNGLVVTFERTGYDNYI